MLLVERQLEEYFLYVPRKRQKYGHKRTYVIFVLL